MRHSDLMESIIPFYSLINVTTGFSISTTKPIEPNK